MRIIEIKMGDLDKAREKLQEEGKTITGRSLTEEILKEKDVK